MKFGGKLAKGVPILSGAIVMGSGLANGKDVGDVGLDVVMSVTNADLAGEAIDYVAAPAVEAMENQKIPIKSCWRNARRLMNNYHDDGTISRILFA